MDDTTGSQTDIDGIDHDHGGSAADSQPGTAARIVPAWLISFAAHATIGLVFSMFVFNGMKEGPIELPPMVLNQLPPQPEAKREPKETVRDLRDIPVTAIEQPTPEKDKIIEPVVMEPLQDPVDTSIATPEGREDAVSTIEHGSTGAFMTIGAGRGAGGVYGKRTGIGRIAMRRGGDGPRRYHEDAVDAALRWFKKHQSANGMWDSVGYYLNCPGDEKCEKGAAHEQSDANIAATAFALRCFLGAGYDHRSPTKYQPVVERGLAWLLEQQQRNGLWGNRNYEHAVATMAVAEAFGMTEDGALRGPAQHGVDVLLQKQNRDGKGSGGLGWDYTEPTGRNDSSVTGWCVMALKSAYASKLDVKGGLDGSRAWLKETYELANPNHAQIDPYNGVAEFGYSWKNGAWEGEQHGDRVPLGALCSVFLGYGDHAIARTLVNYAVKNQLPSEYPCNTYYLYYNTLAVFQLGGEAWRKWNDTACTMLVKAQRRDGCFDGSWDFTGTQFHGHQLGRMFSTALCCLSLEVFWIYDRIGTRSTQH